MPEPETPPDYDYYVETAYRPEEDHLGPATLKPVDDFDIEAELEQIKFKEIGDEDPRIRNAFIRKVYGFLLILLGITFGIALPFTFIPGADQWFADNPPLWIVPMVSSFVCLIILACVPGLDKKFPWNILLCAVIAVSMGILLGALGAYYTAPVFAAAMGITLFIVLGLTLFACQVKWDFTGAGPYLFVILLCFISVSIISIFFYSDTLRLVLCSIGLVLFSCFLVYDTQRIVGGKHVKHKFGVDDYVLATICLYYDVIHIFTYVLELIGR